MNLVVAESHRRRGIAKALLDEVFDRTDDAGRRGIHAGGARVERRRAAALRGDGLPPPGRPARLLHGQPRGRRDHVARRRGVERERDPRARDLLRRDGCGARSRRDGDVLASVVASQAELHAPFGGVVPEVAARRHLELVSPVVEAALHDADATLGDVDLVAATRGPGLVGALLVGLSAAKALAWGLSLPLAAGRPPARPRGVALPRPDPVEPPFVCLLATGGHTMVLDVTAHDRYTVLGQTLDDAAGEAFDKGARLLGLGYPGGAELERARPRRRSGRRTRFRSRRVDGLDFSFSGVKTALLYAVKELAADELEERRADLAASYQRAIVDALVAAGAPGSASRPESARDRDRRRRRRERRAAERTAGSRRGSARALHRQCRDDRLRRPLGGAAAAARLPRPRCVCQRGVASPPPRSSSAAWPGR